MAHPRTAPIAVWLLAGCALLGALVLPPTAAAAGSPPPTPAPTGTVTGHATATRVATVNLAKLAVPRTSAASAGIGVPASAGGGAAAVRALRRPGATTPRRFDLSGWQPQEDGAGSAAVAPSSTGLDSTSAAASPSAPSAVGLRSELGLFGIGDADNSQLYSDCSVDELCEEPPDPSVAVSKTAVVESANELTMLVDRATDASEVVANFDFFSLDNGQVAQSAPRVLYDAGRQRWLATEVSSDCSHSYLDMAISASDDPAGIWTVYRVVFPGRFIDLPGVGTSDSEVVVGLNVYAPDPNSLSCLAPGDFQGGMIVAVDWANLTATVPTLPATTTTPDPKLFTWRPATSIGGDPLVRVVVAIDNGTPDTSDVGYATVSGSNATHDVTLSPVVDLTTTQALPAFATPPAPRQPGTPATIVNAVDGQPTDAIAAGRNLWFISTAPCTPAGDDAVRDCVRVTDLATSAAPASVGVTSDTILSEIGEDLFTGGLGRALDGSLFVVYSRSSSVDVVSGWATWRGPSDAGFHAPSLILPGAGTYSGARWGDTVLLAPDPAAPDAVWQADEAPTVDGTWFTWVSRLRAAPTTLLGGSLSVNGGDAFTSDPYVDLLLANPPDGAETVVRVSNTQTMLDGALVGGQMLPIAADEPWSLDLGRAEGLPEDGPRSVFVQWGDGRGHWSAVVSDAITLDTTPPTIGAVGAPQIGTSSLGASGTVPVVLRWGAGHDALAGLEGYDVEISEDGNDFETFATTGSPSASGRIATGHDYTFQVRAFDRIGNASEWVESPTVHVNVIDDTAPGLHYDASWRRSTAGSAYRGGSHEATTAGATVTLTFTGRDIALAAATGPGLGTLGVTIDGKSVGRFVESAPTSRTARIGFSATVSSGRHTLVVTALDGRPVNLDAAIVLR